MLSQKKVSADKEREAAEAAQAAKAARTIVTQEMQDQVRAERQEKIEAAKAGQKALELAKKTNSMRNFGTKWGNTMVPSALVTKTSLRREEALKRAQRMHLSEGEQEEFLFQEE